MVPGPEGFEIVPETLPETSPAAVGYETVPNVVCRIGSFLMRA
jgi:hypothetical protein